MSRHSLELHELLDPRFSDRSSRGVKGRARLTILGCVQPGLLATLLLVYFVIASRPAPRDVSPPTWSTSTDHTLGVGAVAIASDGQRLATGGTDGSAMLWTVGTGWDKTLSGEGSQGVLCLAFSPDDATLAAGYRDSSVALWDVKSGQKRVTLQGHSGAVRSLAFSPDGSTLATGSEDETIRLWQVGSGHIEDVLAGHRRPVVALSFGPDGRMLASGCSEGRVKLWDRTGGKAHERPGPRTSATRWWAWHLRPTARSWRREARAAASNCGRSRRLVCPQRSGPMTTRSRRSTFLPTGGPCSRRA